MAEAPAELAGTCYFLGDDRTATISPGSRLDLHIGLPDGTTLRSSTSLPGDFDFLTPSAPKCVLPPQTAVETMWTMSEGASAYVNETLVFGVGEALGLSRYRGDEPVELLGVSVAETDTVIQFPDEYGTFSRFDLGSRGEFGTPAASSRPEPVPRSPSPRSN